MPRARRRRVAGDAGARVGRGAAGGIRRRASWLPSSIATQPTGPRCCGATWSTRRSATRGSPDSTGTGSASSRAPYAPPSVEGRIDHALFEARLDYELRLLAREQAWLEAARLFMPFAPQITGLVEARGRLETIVPERAAAALDAIADDIDAAMRRLDAPPPTWGDGALADAGRARQIAAMRAAEVLTTSSPA
ncbi:MAG TPA: hypothetical protein VNK92_06505 [Vicinamibacterales bacterium]|nr:hypothetical protein [Vicinamibacterales bacterium]